MLAVPKCCNIFLSATFSSLTHSSSVTLVRIGQARWATNRVNELKVRLLSQPSFCRSSKTRRSCDQRDASAVSIPSHSQRACKSERIASNDEVFHAVSSHMSFDSTDVLKSKILDQLPTDLALRVLDVWNYHMKGGLSEQFARQQVTELFREEDFTPTITMDEIFTYLGHLTDTTNAPIWTKFFTRKATQLSMLLKQLNVQLLDTGNAGSSLSGSNDSLPSATDATTGVDSLRQLQSHGALLTSQLSNAPSNPAPPNAPTSNPAPSNAAPPPPSPPPPNSCEDCCVIL
jgi:hypothetical protein